MGRAAEEIRRNKPASRASPNLPAPASAMALGNQRLKLWQRPQRVEQIVALGSVHVFWG